VKVCSQADQATAGWYVLLTSANLEERQAAGHVNGTTGVVPDHGAPGH
jgi:hypothetical protein